MSELIVICGTPGTGKTEVAKRLQKFTFKVIHLSDLVIREKLYLKYDEERSSYVIDLDKLIKRITELYNQNPVKLVIEGVSAETLPNHMVDLCFVLICEPGELEKRLRKKGYPPSKIAENLEAERLNLIWGEALDNYGPDKVVVIDTTRLTIDETAQKIIKEIRKRKIG